MLYQYLASTALALSLPFAAATVTSQTTLSGNYTPSVVACPVNHTFIRPASDGLSPSESAWRIKRHSNVVPSLEAYLKNVRIPGFDVASYISDLGHYIEYAPVTALTLSGGGNRAELSGLGMYQALDSRHPASWAAKTGGLLQTMTYISGLSGGSIALSGLAVNGFPTLYSLLRNGNLNFSTNEDAFYELAGKAELGFPLGIADVFGITTGYYYHKYIGNSSIDPMSLTWSGIQANPAFANGSVPMPIHMLDEVIPPGLNGSVSYQTVNGSILYAANTSQTYYEYTPFGFGSWTGRIKAFVDLEYFGTPMARGLPVNSTDCVTGYDTSIFLLGTAEAAINLWLVEQDTNGTEGQFAKRKYIPYPKDEGTLEQIRTAKNLAGPVADLPGIEQIVGNTNLSSILYGAVPNPFYGIVNSTAVTSQAASQKELLLADGSETGMENPLWPLIQPARKLDFIVVSDNDGSELSSGWMNGTNLLNTYILAKASGIPFPKIPSSKTMLNLKYTSAPVFFGCDETDVPLILYAADFPYTAYTNSTVFVDGFTNAQLELLTNNALPLISQKGLRNDWPACLACGVIKKSLSRLGVPLPETCTKCFKDYCWHGQVDNSPPSFLEPSLVLHPSITYKEWNSTIFY